MITLINETNVEYNALLTLLRQKIEESIINEKAICISIESSIVNYLDAIYVENYKVDEERIYLSKDNFELDILFDNNIASIEYTDIYLDEYFKIIHNNNTEIRLYFYLA